jgi:hypothetical protein
VPFGVSRGSDEDSRDWRARSLLGVRRGHHPRSGELDRRGIWIAGHAGGIGPFGRRRDGWLARAGGGCIERGAGPRARGGRSEHAGSRASSSDDVDRVSGHRNARGAGTAASQAVDSAACGTGGTGGTGGTAASWWCSADAAGSIRAARSARDAPGSGVAYGCARGGTRGYAGGGARGDSGATARATDRHGVSATSDVGASPADGKRAAAASGVADPVAPSDQPISGE